MTQDDAVAIDPNIEIVDPHHHLWDGMPVDDENFARPYLWPDYQRDLAGPHNVVQTVAVDCSARYRSDGPEALRPVGETAFFLASGKAAGGGMCAGIVGHADLTLGDAVGEVLDAHIAAAEGRFRGIRHMTGHEPGQHSPRPPGIMASAAFHRGFAQLAPRALSFDAWLYHPQLGELCDLAKAHPETQIILDHCGGLLRIGRFADRRDEAFAGWRDSLAALAELPNIAVKVGGLGMHFSGSPLFGLRPPAPTDAIAEDWRPHIETCIDLFGPARCMFESNFPVDRGTCGYTRLWNVFQTIAAQYSADERASLFHGTARRVYRLG